ncbi:uridylate kinase [Methanoplanus endosymbiosus]|uniref:Uridylate kinase n=1 Tax=Methanoplanus endosymbiosus TaxID=33865 RepID=A0A9E7PLI5_9EURY|nr:uridylate kinase [Methanoplanus endosymbiosus]UUX91179.1 uridylate kinase [Methanoplanus endosymbiosus]
MDGFSDKSPVIKIGGSLTGCAGEIIRAIESSGVGALIVPGGGESADIVRRLDPDDDTAHWMAILAMEQFGFYLSGFGVPVTVNPENKDGLEILLPYRILYDKDPLPHSWDITSDSVAAWVAGLRGSDLILVKSVDKIRSDGEYVTEISDGSKFINSGDVDEFFVDYALKNDITVYVINGRDPEKLKNFLKTGTGFGTRIIRSY